MLEDSNPKIFNLMTECEKQLTRLIVVTEESTKNNMTQDMQHAAMVFRECRLHTKYYDDFKPTSDIAGGIDRYPNTTFLLMDLLEDLKNQLVNTFYLSTRVRHEMLKFGGNRF